MKNLILIRDRIENRISYYHLAVFLIALPFDRFYSQLALFSFIVHALIHIDRPKLKAAFTLHQLIVSAVWLVGLLGMIYSTNKKHGLDDLMRQSAILLFPFFLTVSGFPLQQYWKKLLGIFGITCLAVILYLFGDAFYFILHYRLPLSTLYTLPFINHNFSAPIGIHATYLSMYVCLSLVFFMDCFFREKTTAKRILFVLAMLILLGGLMQLASRAVLLATVFMFIIAFPFFLPKGTLRVRFITTALLVSLLALIGIFSIDSFKKRFITGLKDDLTQASFNNEILEPRLSRWELVIELIKKKPLIGYGTGTERNLLKEAYFKNKYFNSYLHELNAHNEYLSLWLKNGIPGLLVFLLTLVYWLRIAWKKKNVLFATFMVLICIVSFTENIFDVNKGIFFYAFFLSCFTWQQPQPAKNHSG